MSQPYHPHDYQMKAIRFLIERGAAGLLLDPGLGKSSITLAAFKLLKSKGLAKRALVVAPLRVCHEVWPREAEKWEDFNELKVVVLHGPKKEQLLDEEADLYCVNPEGLAWLTEKKRLQGLGVDVLVVDELSKFKHSNTKRFKLLKPHLSSFRRRWGLTGSPAPNGLLDLFGQIYVLDQGRSLGAYVTHYRMSYFIPTGYGGYNWVLKPGAAEAIYERLKPLVLRMEATDYLDLPEMVENDVMVTLPAAAQRVYTDMESTLLALVNAKDEVVTAASTAAALLKCRQIASGGLYRQFEAGEGPRVHSDRWAHLHDAKTEAVCDLVDELNGQPLLIAYDFEHDKSRLLKALGDVPFIGGGTSTKQTSAIVSDWNKGKIPVLLAHPQSAGHGLNLQAAGNHVLWYSLTWDYELYDQFNRRILRQGNEHSHVFVHRLLARGTVDEVIAKALSRKCKTQNALLSALKDAR